MSAVMAVLPEVEDVLAPFYPRPHWGKLFTVDIEALSASYEKWSDFGLLLRELDPGGKFRNEFVKQYFPL